MKILFFNALYEPGHKYVDKKNIYNLSQISELTVLAPDRWYDELPKSVNYKNLALEQKKDARRINAWICALRNCWRAAKLARHSPVDIIIFGEYELITIPIAIKFFPKGVKVIVCNHNNVDQLEKSIIKRLLFNMLRNKVYHCAFEPFIKDRLVEKYNLSKERIFVWPHPTERPMKCFTHEDIIYDCVGISNSNDEETIKSIYENEVRYGAIKARGQHIVLRAKTLTPFDDGYLTLIKGWISQKEYERYFNQAKSILISFPQSFQYRVSATVLDGLINKKIIIGADIPLMRYYSQRYPSLCFIYENGKILDAIADMDNYEMNAQSYSEFLYDHSDLNIQSIMKSDLSHIQDDI